MQPKSYDVKSHTAFQKPSQDIQEDLQRHLDKDMNIIMNRKQASLSYVVPVPLLLKSVVRIIPPQEHTPEQQQRKLNEIGQQINTILSQGNKLSRSRKGQIHRPQSDLINMYDIGKNPGPRFKQQSQNDISHNLINSSANLNSVNSTNLNIRKKQMVGGGFEGSAEDTKRGTETERSYNNNKIARDNFLLSMKQNQNSQRPQKITLNKTSKDYSSSSSKVKNHLNIIHEIMQFQKSVNDDNMGSQDIITNQKSYQKVFDKIDELPTESQKNSSQKLVDQKQVYLSYLQSMQKKPLQFQLEHSPAQNDTKLSRQPNPYLNSSGVDLVPWSSDKQDIEANTNQRVSSCYTLNQQSQSQSSFRNQDEKKTEKENSKSENTTSRNNKNKVVVQNYINERTPTKNLFNLKNFQSPKIASVLVSNSKVNSLLTSINKFNRSSDKYDPLSQLLYNQSLEKPIIRKKNDIINQSQIFLSVDPKPLIVVEDPNHTHKILALGDFTIRMLNIYSRKVNLIGKHKRPISSLSIVIFDTNLKIFYSGSRDGIIKLWGSISMQGTYKLTHQFRVQEAPLKLLLDEQYLHVITSSQILRINNETHQVVDKVKYQGHLKDVILTPFNEIIIAINNKIYKYSKGSLILQCGIRCDISQLAYSNLTIYVLGVDGETISYKDGIKLKQMQQVINQAQLDELFSTKSQLLMNENSGQSYSPTKKI